MLDGIRGLVQPRPIGVYWICHAVAHLDIPDMRQAVECVSHGAQRLFSLEWKTCRFPRDHLAGARIRWKVDQEFADADKRSLI